MNSKFVDFKVVESNEPDLPAGDKLIPINLLAQFLEMSVHELQMQAVHLIESTPDVKQRYLSFEQEGWEKTVILKVEIVA